MTCIQQNVLVFHYHFYVSKAKSSPFLPTPAKIAISVRKSGGGFINKDFMLNVTFSHAITSENWDNRVDKSPLLGHIYEDWRTG